MFYVKKSERDVPWHGFGKPLSVPPPDTESAIIDAGLDKAVELVAIQTVDGYDCPGNAVRYVDQPDVILSWVGDNWQPLQNRKMFKPFDRWIESGELELHTAGSLCGGRKVWVQGEINPKKYGPMEITKGDIIRKYVLLSNSHTYGRSIYFGFTPHRVVCANTEAIAVSSEASKLLRVRHNSQIEQNLEKVAEIMNLVNQEFEGAAEKFRWLVTQKVANQDDLKKYFKVVLGKENVEDKDLKTRTKNCIDRLYYLYEHGKGQELADVRGSWYAAYNGVAEWLTHERSSNNETRLDSLWFGPNRATNQKAFDTAMVMASLN